MEFHALLNLRPRFQTSSTWGWALSDLGIKLIKLLINPFFSSSKMVVMNDCIWGTAGVFDGQPASNELKFSISFLSCLLRRVVLKRKCSLLLLYPFVQALRKCMGFFFLLFLTKSQVKRGFSASSSWEQQCIQKHKKDNVKKKTKFHIGLLRNKLCFNHKSEKFLFSILEPWS